MRYAQEYGDQKLHLVHELGRTRVSFRALCGRTPRKRGTWRMTINAPLGHACRNCLRVWRSARGEGKWRVD